MIPLLSGGALKHYAGALIQPAYDAQSGTNGLNVSSVTWTHTVGASLTNSCLIVLTAVTAGSANGNSTTGVTYNGVSMLAIPGAVGFSNSTTSRIMKMWYMLNPPSGAHSVVATFNTGTAINNACGSVSLQHVNQSTPFGTVAESDGTASNSVSVTATSSLASDLIVAGIVDRNNALTSGGSLTPRSSNSQGTGTYTQIATAVGTGSNVACSYTWTNTDNYVLVGFAVHGATA